MAAKRIKSTPLRSSHQVPTRATKEEIDGFLAKFEPGTAKLVQVARKTLRQLMPSAVELIYDNYNFLVFGFCSSEKASDCVCSVAASSGGVILSFYYGASLPDRQKILQGTGKQNRFIRIEDARILKQPEVLGIIEIAIEHAKTPLPEDHTGYTIVKSISAKQRPRKK